MSTAIRQTGSLQYVSSVIGRNIYSTDELTSEDYWEIIFDFLGVDKKKIVAI